MRYSLNRGNSNIKVCIEKEQDISKELKEARAAAKWGEMKLEELP